MHGDDVSAAYVVGGNFRVTRLHEFAEKFLHLPQSACLAAAESLFMAFDGVLGDMEEDDRLRRIFAQDVYIRNDLFVGSDVEPLDFRIGVRVPVCQQIEDRRVREYKDRVVRIGVFFHCVHDVVIHFIVFRRDLDPVEVRNIRDLFRLLPIVAHRHVPPTVNGLDLPCKEGRAEKDEEEREQ